MDHLVCHKSLQRIGQIIDESGFQASIVLALLAHEHEGFSRGCVIPDVLKVFVSVCRLSYSPIRIIDSISTVCIHFNICGVGNFAVFFSRRNLQYLNESATATELSRASGGKKKGPFMFN
jgi:hypothetical protein